MQRRLTGHARAAAKSHAALILESADMLWLSIGGRIELIAGAELLVRGASRLALSFGISPLLLARA